MKVPRVNMKGLQIDVAGAAAVVALLAVGYFVLIRGPLADVRAGRNLGIEQRDAAEAINALNRQYLADMGELKAKRSLLARRAGWLSHPDLPDEILSRLNELARACDVRIVRWQPQGAQAFAQYRVQTYSVEGAARWPGLLRWFALIEEGAPLLDVTHFTVTASADPSATQCEFACSLKLYLGKTDEALQMAAVKP